MILKTLIAVQLFLSSMCFALAPKKVILVIFENGNYNQSMAQSYFAKFANTGVLLSNFHAETHPSQPNYIALMAGSPMGNTNDSNINIDAIHFADLLEGHGLSWRVYAEAFPGNCFLGATKKTYARKHNPLISFRNVQNNPARCANITDATSFSADFHAGRLADFTMYVPDLNNDGHDTGVAFASRWFEQTFAPILADSAMMKNTMIVALFDENDGGGTNQIYVAMNGPDVQGGMQINTSYNHYSLLRTLEDIYGTGNLGREDAKAAPISGYLK
ncbi:MAG: alkaline phosphatase family protein [Bdellovibrionales bacterium]